MKIYIIGSVGSGKTTLAHKLSALLEIPHFETDNFVWQRQGGADVRRVESSRDGQFFAAVAQEVWIIEGVHISWTEKALWSADFVVFLDVPYHMRTLRFVSRYLKQKMGKERSNYKPSFSMLRKMFGWNHSFEKMMKPAFLEQLETAPGKVVILKNQQQTKEFIADLVQFYI